MVRARSRSTRHSRGNAMIMTAITNAARKSRVAIVRDTRRHDDGGDISKISGCYGRETARGWVSNRNSIASSLSNSTRWKTSRIAFVWVCAALSLSARYEYLPAVEASSNSGNSGSVPFMVMSEITVQSDDDGNHDGAGAGSSDVLASGDSQKSGGSADGTDVKSSANGETGDGGVTSGVEANNYVSGGARMSAGAGGSGSDTDGEDDEDEIDNENDGNRNGGRTATETSISTDALAESASESTAASSSQPLRTLKRLQAMLDDTDYATHTVASAPVIGRTNTIGDGVEDNQVAASSTSAPTTSTPSPTDKLWTSRDRAKYRRTRRTEKQRQEQQQRQYEEQHARKLRDIQRQRIIREERERKELEELRRKQGDVMERQKYEQQRRQQLQQEFLHADETDLTDDDTDTDGRGFELPNLPVYLSDGETDDFSEEADDAPKLPQRRRPIPPQNYSPPNPQQVYQPPRQSIGQNMARPYQYNYPEMQQNQQQQQQQPPPQANTPYQNYPHPPPYYQQQQQQQQQQQPQQQQQTMPQYQYGNSHQQIQHNQRQYEQQYAAWAHAAANGYYYPPPPPPSTAAFQNHQQAAHQPQQNQQPQRPAYTPQSPYAAQHQQQNQGAAPYATHHQHPYQQQQGGPHSSSRAAFSIRPQHASFPPRSQASQAYRNNEKHGFFTPNKDGSNEWRPMGQQQEQQRGDRDVNDAAASGFTNDLTSAAAESERDDLLEGPTEETTSNITTTTSIDAHGPMAIQSAFVAPTSPLISPVSSRGALPTNAEGPYSELIGEADVLIAGTESRITFDSVQKLAFSTIGVSLLSYCAVSPRSLPFPEYNRLFLQNLSIVWLAAIAPLVSLLSVYDGKYNNINTAIGTFHVSFTLGYALAFISEVILTTAVRLGVFKIWEPAIFSLTPEVPSIILPWVLREKQYKPKRITLFAADFAASCVASPIIEEYLKLKVVQWTCNLPRNFKHSKKVQKSKRRRRKNTLQPVKSLDAAQVTNINCYVTQMLAASLGLKLFDVTRRILMYTKETDDFKHIYAICRGTFPIHELCGTMTALGLARRDVIGVNLPMWKILGPAVFIHGMANFRGKKPIFKWNSSTPWSEMQINQLKRGDIMRQLLPKSYAKIVWITILCRVFGFCIKNYYLIGRQAMKRTTTYSGKLHAFNAKLHTDAILKQAKD